MGEFLSEPVVKPLNDGKYWTLAEPLKYYSDTLQIVVCVPVGFKFDFASIPRMFWRLIGGPASGKYRWAAIVHDYLCSLSENRYDRKLADDVFYEAMTDCGENRIKRAVMWAAVRLQGIFKYRKG